MINITVQQNNEINSYPFEKETITIGKNIDCDIFLNDKKVSKIHAELSKINHKWSIKDLDSTNGTFVNEKRIQKILLQREDQIRIGSYILTFSSQVPSTENKITQEIQKSLEHPNIFLVPKDTLKERLSSKIEEALNKNNIEFKDLEEKQSYIAKQLEEMLGLGFLEAYLKDPTISEIMINGSKNIYIEKNNILYKMDKISLDKNILSSLIDRILFPIGRHVDEASPMVDAKLPDGSRINVILPPIAINGPMITIRKFKPMLQTLEDLLNLHSITFSQATLLKDLIQKRKNIMISGGTSSGKTTLLNILSNSIYSQERIITIEDCAELKLHQPHTLSLEARPSNIEGRGEISLRMLVQNALRMRPDRIIVGECRGAEAFDMLTAMNTGHKGCLSTCHANSPRDALKRIETMVMMAKLDLPSKAIREYITSAIDIIIQTQRDSSGKRTVTHITEICGMEGETILTQDLGSLDPKEKS